MIATLAAFVGSLLGAVVVNFFSSRRAREERNYKFKSDIYDEIISLFADFLKAAKEKEEIELTLERAFEIKKKLMIRASQDVFRAWRDFEENTLVPNRPPESIIGDIEKLVKCIRKDLGHPDVPGSPLEFFGIFLKAEERLEFEEKMRDLT